jgi:hypothetical protein
MILVGWSALVLLAGVERAGPPASSGQSTASARFVDRLDVSSFQKGNLHAHSLASDGDTDPFTVVSWYAAHGYAFVALTDHNVYFDASMFRPTRIVVIPGEEVTMRAARGPVHVNALCADGEIGGHLGVTVFGSLDWAARQIRDKHGVVLINHPNDHWMVSATDLAAVGGPALLEIYSGRRASHTAGDADHPSHEELWDTMLSAGAAYTGVAVDDAHHFEKGRRRRVDGGLGWVQVFASEARQDLICDALRAGRLYASSGPELDRLVVDGDTMSVWPSDSNATVEFIGQGGQVLADSQVPWPAAARYRLRGDEDYVRARITIDGRRAWTNAYRVKR